MIDISKINLNLLITLDALLTECHVTRAAEALGVSQAAMSASLRQLRDIFQDSLLVRGQQGVMTMTPLAETLQNQVRIAIDSIQNVFSGSEAFDPASSRRIFHLGMSDYIAFVIMPKLMKHLAKHAPSIQIVQHAVNFMDSYDPIENQGCDIVIGDFSNAPESLKSQRLFTDKGFIIADKNHAIFKQKRMTLSAIASYPQIFVSLEGASQKNFILEYMREKHKDVSVALFTPHTLISLFALPGTQLIAHSVEKLASPLVKFAKLKMVPAPYQFPDYKACQYWHLKMNDDPAHRWLRETIRANTCINFSYSEHKSNLLNLNPKLDPLFLLA